jgi:L-serine dehydratase
VFLSVFDIFKIGIGPSSSHTMGPMTAARRFLTADLPSLPSRPHRVSVSLHGSLAFTGHGHGTDRAVALGLLGYAPDLIDPDHIEPALADLRREKSLRGPAAGIQFDPDCDILFDAGPPLPGHVNGLIFRAHDDAGDILTARTYYSIGGGFVQSEQELGDNSLAIATPLSAVPHDFRTANEMLRQGETSMLSIAAMQRANEFAAHADIAFDERLDNLWRVMNDCIDRGLTHDGVLPGGLQVKRRAPNLYRQINPHGLRNEARPAEAMDWLSVYAMAVNEENAAGGRVVTAPTNGAAGVVPAVLRYYRDHITNATVQGIRDFLLAAAAIGGLIKRSASISGAEVGCQGEVGSAAAMAAAGLAAALGGSNGQIENAAEIALEHHLGMTCDPIAGLVQIPCIERNSFGAVKAVNSAMLALRGDGTHIVSLDNCIRTMRDTGRDMNSKYKETSLGGLAVNVVAC